MQLKGQCQQFLKFMTKSLPEQERAPERFQDAMTRLHVKALRIKAFWCEIGRTPGCLAWEALGPGKSHGHECETHEDHCDDVRTME